MQQYFFQYGVVVFITSSIIIGNSTGRELRPSEHGLTYQNDASSPTQNGDEREMLSFFGPKVSVGPPGAQTVGNDTWWNVHGDGGSRDIRRDHVRVGLVVATAVCGSAGVVLLVVSGVVFIVRRQKQKEEAERLPSTTHLHAVNDK